MVSPHVARWLPTLFLALWTQLQRWNCNQLQPSQCFPHKFWWATWAPNLILPPTPLKNWDPLLRIFAETLCRFDEQNVPPPGQYLFIKWPLAAAFKILILDLSPGWKKRQRQAFFPLPRHHGGRFRASPETLRASQYSIVLRGLRGALN